MLNGKRTRVVICSPYRGDVQGNLQYAKACLADSIARNEAPFASHIIYPIVLRDETKEREVGMACEAAWINASEAVVLYIDRGISEGMLWEAMQAQSCGVAVKLRSLDKGDDREVNLNYEGNTYRPDDQSESPI